MQKWGARCSYSNPKRACCPPTPRGQQFGRQLKGALAELDEYGPASRRRALRKKAYIQRWQRFGNLRRKCCTPTASPERVGPSRACERQTVAGP